MHTLSQCTAHAHLEGYFMPDFQMDQFVIHWHVPKVIVRMMYASVHIFMFHKSFIYNCELAELKYENTCKVKYKLKNVRISFS